jgi:hypothetical protein
MVNIEAEVNRHRNCKDRDELEKVIREYKNLAIQHAKDFTVAGQYNTVAFKLQEFCDKLPAPHIKIIADNRPSAPVKTATITSDEQARIRAEWRKRAKK